MDGIKKKVHAENVGNQAAAQTTTHAEMLNNGVGTVKFQEKKDWSGSVFGSYPQSIATSRSGKFSHRGVPPQDVEGSMGGIVYVGPRVQGGSDDCAWVFAWSVAGDGTPNKVYAECGLASKYPPGNINWDKIKTSLTTASSEIEYSDDTSRSEISASIDASGNTPALAVVFQVNP